MMKSIAVSTSLFLVLFVSIPAAAASANPTKSATVAKSVKSASTTTPPAPATFAANKSKSCMGDSAIYRILPSEIGREGDVFKVPFSMPCDSMVVPEGTKTIIHPAAMLYFQDTTKASNKITVRGTLIAAGTPTEPIFFCGSITNRPRIGLLPGEAKWEGIELEPGGKIEFQNVRFINGSSALVIISPNISVYNAHFKGTPNLILPDTILELGMPEARIDTLVLKEHFFLYRADKTRVSKTGLSPNQPAQNNIEVKPNSGLLSNKKAWFTAAGLGAVAVLGVIFWPSKKDDTHTPPPPPVIIPNTNSATDPAPELPNQIPPTR